MVPFKYLPNILQHSSLNGCFHEESENKTANVFSMVIAIFTVVNVISVWMHYNYDDYKMKICTLLISF